MIVIIDYDVGNIAAVANMLRRIGQSCTITAQPELVEQASRIILPGNGSYDACMRNLRATGLVPTLAAGGRIALDDALQLTLDGHIARWPAAWPALPAPLAGSDAPMPFALRYAGPAGFDAPLALRIERISSNTRAVLIVYRFRVLSD